MNVGPRAACWQQVRRAQAGPLALNEGQTHAEPAWLDAFQQIGDKVRTRHVDLEVLLERLPERAFTCMGGDWMFRVPALKFDHLVNDVRRVLRDDAKRVTDLVGHARIPEVERDVAVSLREPSPLRM